MLIEITIIIFMVAVGFICSSIICWTKSFLAEKIDKWWCWTRHIPYYSCCSNAYVCGIDKPWYCPHYKKINKSTFYCKYLNKKSNRMFDWKMCKVHQRTFLGWIEQYFWYLPKRKIIDLKLNIKRFIQRGFRGYADSDVWGFDYFLSDVIVKGLKNLKQNKHGYPVGLKNKKEWDKILDNIIYTFEISLKIINGDYLYVPMDEYNKKQQKELKNLARRLNKISKTKALTKKQYDKYVKGWGYFKEHFMSLWD